MTPDRPRHQLSPRDVTGSGFALPATNNQQPASATGKLANTLKQNILRFASLFFGRLFRCLQLDLNKLFKEALVR